MELNLRKVMVFVSAAVLAWYDIGLLSRRRLLDPKTLSVPQLKALLDSRGVSYRGAVVEKQDLSDHVDRSGPVGESEMELVMKMENEETTEEETFFTSTSRFHEQVEDAKDTVWLLQIQTDASVKPLSPKTWKAIRRRLHRFGVKTATFQCFKDVRFCKKNHWLTPRVVLAVPREPGTNSKVDFFSNAGAMGESRLFNWVHDLLNSTVMPITSPRQFEMEWLSYLDPFLASEIRVVLFQDRHSVPMFFSALSFKFLKRVRFGTVLTNSKCGKELAEEHTWINSSFDAVRANYVIITPEKIMLYGKRVGEELSFSNMETFLISLHPSQNDLFAVGVAVINLVILLKLAITSDLGNFAWGLMKYNVLFLVLWFPIVGISKLPYFDQVALLGLKLFRMATSSDVGAILMNFLHLVLRLVRG